ncbi:MAG: 3-hydroxyacyl-CoA dehydrogenase [Rhodobacteraceae bacterium]|nr:3-hydroxyacyl-CoA dehydrogenase [Paracoccaceae bacterium]
MQDQDIKSVKTEIVGDIALVCVDNPPVNALSVHVRRGIQDAVAEINTAQSAKVIVLYAAGRTFIAGADITEFGKPPMAPALPDLLNEMEQSAIPVVCVLHGTALGGGLEVALASHARVGIKGLRIGLPEVLIGLLPGAGGTQRVPRLAGIPVALDMALSGRQVPAQEALEMGLLDALEEGDPRDVALKAGQEALDGKLVTRRTDMIETKPDDAALDAARQMAARKFSNLVSPQRCIEAIAASTGPIADGLKIERKAFMDCLDTPQRAGLIHAFFGERAVANIPEKKAPPREINAIGVIGGGTMGSGIATSALMAGLPVTLVEVKEEALERGIATITKNLDGGVKRGKLSQKQRDAMVANLKGATDLAAFSDVDLVIEAVFEQMDVKKEIFTTLDSVCKQGAILASNTSYLDINEIAAVTSRPADVIGLHFFSPAHIMKLLEIVVGDKTAPEVVATGFALAKRLKKIGVRAGVCDGFIGNRILAHYSKTASYLVLDGATPQQVDDALEAFGFAMGPHKVGDLAGLDIGWMTRKRKAADRSPEERYAGAVADRICENGWFGRKAGRGYYIYDEGDMHPNPAVAEIIAKEREEAGITSRTFTDEEVVDRYMTAMIVEAARVVEDGIALRPVDVDVVFLSGYGFPRFRGGPLHYADTIGAAELVRRIEDYAKEDAYYWQVPTLLRDMAASGKSFDDINKGG